MARLSHLPIPPLLWLVLTLFGLPVWAVADAPAAAYSFTILEVPGAVYTESRSINASGQVTGSYSDSSGQHGFVYGNGTFTTLGLPDAVPGYIAPSSINDSGQVTGSYYAGIVDNPIAGWKAFVYSNGTSITIINPPNTFNTYAASINASGQVAGSYYTNGGRTSHGFVYSNGTFTTLDVPEATATYAASINASGQVTGSYYDSSGRHGFVYSNGTFTTLDVPGAIDIDPVSINASGQVTGNYQDGFGQYGFVYSNGTFTTLGVPGAIATYVASINASGQVAGYYLSKPNGPIPIYDHGFVYSNGTFTTLDVPGAYGTIVASINDSGQVTGTYFVDSALNSNGFIATPMATDIPTLSQWAMLLAGGLLVGMALLAQVRRTHSLQG